MSVKHMNWAWEQAETHDLTPAETLLLVGLADSAGHEHGVATWINADALAMRVRIAKRSMFRYLGKLGELGLVRRFQLRDERGRCIQLYFWIAPNEGEMPFADVPFGHSLVETKSDGVNAECQSDTPPPNAKRDATRMPNRGGPNATGGTPYKPTTKPPLSLLPTVEETKELSDHRNSINRTAPSQKRGPKRRFAVSKACEEARRAWPSDRRNGVAGGAKATQELFDEACAELGEADVVAACAAYIARLKADGKFDYVVSFARFLRDSVQEWTPGPVDERTWRALLEAHRRDPSYWPERFGPKPILPGCRVPPALLLEFSFTQAA